MQHANITITRKSVLWTYMGTATSMISNFLLLPFLFIWLNNKEIGFWYLLLSINGLISLFDFGFDPSFARNIAYVWSGATNLNVNGVSQVKQNTNVNFKLLAVVVAAARRIYLALSIVATLLIVTIGSVYVDHVVFESLHGTTYVFSWIVFCVSIFINLYYGYMAALLRGTGKIIEVNKAIVFSRVLQIAFSVCLLLLHQGFLAPVVGLFVYGVSFRQLCRHFFFHDSQVAANRDVLQTHIDLADVLDIIKIIWPNSWRDGLVSLSNYAVTQGSALIAGFFMPLGEVGIYSLGVQFASSLTVGANAISAAMHPQVQADYTRRNFHRIRQIVSRSVSIYTITSILGFFTVYFVVFPLLSMFRSSATPKFSLFILLFIYYYLFYLQSTSAAYIADMNEIPYMKSFIVTSALFLVLASIVMHFSGGNPISLILTSIFCQAVYNNWKWPTFLLSRIDTTVVEFVQAQIGLVRNIIHKI